jgi:hypothetical protein
LTYIETLAEEIERHIPAHLLPGGDTRALFLIYAALALAKGFEVDRRDVHNAWAAWMATASPAHESIRPYEELEPDVKREDDPFVTAIRAALLSM